MAGPQLSVRAGQGGGRSGCSRRAFSEDVVLNVLGNEPVSPRGRLDLSDRLDLITQGDGIRATGIYDQLKIREEVLV